MHGRSSAVSEPDALEDLWASDSLVPWASGNRTLFIRIRPDRVTRPDRATANLTAEGAVVDQGPPGEIFRPSYCLGHGG